MARILTGFPPIATNSKVSWLGHDIIDFNKINQCGGAAQSGILFIFIFIKSSSFRTPRVPWTSTVSGMENLGILAFSYSIGLDLMGNMSQ